MNNWFEVKVKYTKQLENGSFKRVTEPYLLAAITFTDAESRIYEELGSIIRGEFHVTSIKPMNFHDIFQYEDSETWYKVKISFQDVNVDTEKSKKTTNLFLVNATSVKEAYERTQESLSTLMVDFDVLNIAVSPIIDIFTYQESITNEN
jgi:hypothetical protein